jgi:hypothetical protein
VKIIMVVVSASRPGNVPGMLARAPGCRWVVPAGQVAEYRRAGADDVMGVEGTLPMKTKQLNAALDEWSVPGVALATLDDDIVRLLAKGVRKEVSLAECAAATARGLTENGLRLGGPYGGTNTSWAPGPKLYGRIPGAMMVHLESPLRFDEKLFDTEDLDYCVQHHVRYGGVYLAGDYCLENLWSDNEGGYQGHRTDDTRAEVTERLQQKWGHLGASFKLADTKNGISYRVPWKRLAEGGKR